MASFICPMCANGGLDAQRTSPCPHCMTLVTSAIGPTSADAALTATTREHMAAKDDDDDEGVSEKPMSKGKKRPADDDEGKVSEKPMKKNAAAGDDDDDDDAPRKKKEEKKGGMGLGMILGIVGLVLTCCICLPAGGAVGFVFLVPKLGGAAARTQTRNNAMQIGIAMHAYHDTFKGFPSQRAAPGDLSWRVSVLPYLEQNNIFMAMDKNGAWDKGPNVSFQQQRPMLYDTPLNPVMDKAQTRFQVFTGPNAVFTDPLAKPKITQMMDGSSNTALFAESSNPVVWTRPADMSIAQGAGLPLPQTTFVMCFGDATVRFMDRSKVNDATMRMLIDPRDGMAIPAGVLD